jgi:hypothetical protein
VNVRPEALPVSHGWNFGADTAAAAVRAGTTAAGLRLAQLLLAAAVANGVVAT